MLKYFDKSFFKFLFGFLLILVIAFAILIIVKEWGERNSRIEGNRASVTIF